MKNIVSFFQDKKGKEPISILTCYDYSFAKLLSKSEIDAILVGDSLGMVIQGQNSTLPVTIEEMIYHTKSVRRGAPEKLIIIDLPFMSYQVSLKEGVRNACKAMKESGADAVKVEGGDGDTLELIYRLTEIGIPVMGHLGFTPQYYQILGGYKVQGRDPVSKEKIINQSRQLENAGAFSVVLEMIPHILGLTITDSIKIPTIGIGAGVHTDGQVLVLYDMLGMNQDFSPKFLKKFDNLEVTILSACKAYSSEVKSRIYPTNDHSYSD